MYDHTFYKLANQQIRHQATHKVGCQPGDFAYGHFQASSRVCVGIHGLTYSFHHLRGPIAIAIVQQ